MPFIEIKLTDGKDPEVLRALLHEVHGAVKAALALPDEAIRITLDIVPSEYWSSGDVTWAEEQAQIRAEASA